MLVKKAVISTIPARARPGNRRCFDILLFLKRVLHSPAIQHIDNPLALWKATLYTLQHAIVIVSFRHKGLQHFFESGSNVGIRPHHAARLRILLTVLHAARCPAELNARAWQLHGLNGEYEGFYALSVNGNWRLTFRFIGTDVELVDYVDYH